MDRVEDKTPLTKLKDIVHMENYEKTDHPHPRNVTVLNQPGQYYYMPPRAFLKVMYPQSIGVVTADTLKDILRNISTVSIYNITMLCCGMVN